ncbi:twin-arginine translocase subunit TatC [Acidaminococcus fermentans]|uniref:twin-arginine translocase subunit TatC n=1 Tax=Acidaminococcus fermentans TaxID=905 RepID=UPI00242B5FB5|nr:twin-arginine translocase subunit TatC [Acidaminococcus fermentans]
MTFAEHLGELRTRLIRCLMGLAVGGALSFWQIDRIVAFLTAPVPQLYVMKPAEAFMIYVKIALWSGAILASPLLAWEFWAFLVPAFTEREKRTLLLFVPSSVLLFLAGLVFSYRLILPQGLQFLLAFSQGAVQPLWSLESYLDFVVLMVLPVGLFFNLPLALLLLAKMGLVTSKRLKKARRYVIVLAFIVAAMITPTTDMVSQTLLALPLFLLYEISLVLIRVFLKR